MRNDVEASCFEYVGDSEAPPVGVEDVFTARICFNMFMFTFSTLHERPKAIANLRDFQCAQLFKTTVPRLSEPDMPKRHVLSGFVQYVESKLRVQ